MFVCPKCGTSLGEPGPGGVLEAVCSGCRYKFQVMRGRCVELTSGLVPARHVLTSIARRFWRAYELRLDLPTSLIVLTFHTRSPDDSITLRRGDVVSVVHTMNGSVRVDLLSVTNDTTGERFPLGSVGGEARRKASFGSAIVAASVAVGAIIGGASGAIIIAAPLLTAVPSWLGLTKLFAPVQTILPGARAELAAQQDLLRRKQVMLSQKLRIDADSHDKLTVIARLTELQRKMRAVALASYEPRIEAVGSALAALDAQLALDRQLIACYERSIMMVDIEYETGIASGALDRHAGAEMVEKLEELRELEERHAHMTRDLEANGEIARLLKPATA
jgi:hypothetical protein